jgi:hypothetical protein
VDFAKGVDTTISRVAQHEAEAGPLRDELRELYKAI